MAAEDRTGPVLMVVAALMGFVAATYRTKDPVKAPAPSLKKLGVNPAHAVSKPVPALGLGARSPAEIPGRGWWIAIKQTANGFSEDRLMTEAAGCTFYTLLAIFPALASLISLYGLIADPATIAAQIATLEGVVPGGGMDILKDQVASLTSHGSQALGFGLISGVLISLWSANSGVKSLFDALNIVYHERERRSFIARTLLSLCFTMGALLFLITSLASIVVVPIVFNYVGLGSATAHHFGRAALAADAGGADAVPGVDLPLRPQPAARALAMGQLGQRIRLHHLGDRLARLLLLRRQFRQLQQDLWLVGGRVIGFMTWIWISTMVVLLGGELNAELERQAGCRP